MEFSELCVGVGKDISLLPQALLIVSKSQGVNAVRLTSTEIYIGLWLDGLVRHSMTSHSTTKAPGVDSCSLLR